LSQANSARGPSRVFLPSRLAPGLYPGPACNDRSSSFRFWVVQNGGPEFHGPDIPSPIDQEVTAMLPFFRRLNRQNDCTMVRSTKAVDRSRPAPKLRRRKRMSVEVLEDRQLLATITVNTTADNTGVG